jgi:hypothetical protein
MLKGVDSMAQIVVEISCSGVDREIFSADVRIRDDAWTALTYDKRLRLAQMLWNGAVQQSKFDDHPDSVHVKLLGEAGERLGGSNDFAGSILDVSKD